MSRPQVFLWSFDLMLVCLVILTGTFFLLTIYSILQSNADLLPEGTGRFLSVKILDTSSAASLFVTLLGALLLRHQFALGLLPRITYKSTNAVKADATGSDKTLEIWRVEIQNAGLGAAIITGAEYSLKLPDTKTDRSSSSYSDLTAELTKSGLVCETDYWLENITANFALSPRETCVVFEIRKDQLQKIGHLDMVLHFRNQLGGKYTQKVRLVPHR